MTSPRHMRPAPASQHAGGHASFGGEAPLTERLGVAPTSLRPAAAPSSAAWSVPQDGRGADDVLWRQARPSQPYDDAFLAPSAPKRQPARAAFGASAVLSAAAAALRLAAAALCVIVLANALARGFMWPLVVEATAVVSRALPSAVSGRLVVPTILGGTFRGDIAVAAIALFAADWACVRLAQGMRGR